jgi:hypothetical protein
MSYDRKASWIIRVALLTFICALPAPSDATPVSYAFTLIAADDGPVGRFNSNMFPAINGTGTVAFEALTQTGIEGIFIGNGGTLMTVATNGPGSPFAFFGPGMFAGPAINEEAAVAFRANLSIGGQGIFVGQGGSVTTIAETSGPPSGFQGVAINNSGTVGFGFESIPGTPGNARIVTARDGVFVTIAEASGLFGGVSLNDRGVVAFLTNPILPGSGLFTGSGGALTTIASTSVQGPFFQITEPSINLGGIVAFQADLTSGGVLGGTGIFAGNGGPIMTIADDSGPYAFFSGPSINAHGEVAFRTVLDTGSVGIFTGPDPLLDRVITMGDLLFGSEVRTLDFGGGQALNDIGQVAFRATLADGRTVVARADPVAVPEPSTLVCLAFGLIALVVTSGHRTDRIAGCRRVGRGSV